MIRKWAIFSPLLISIIPLLISCGEKKENETDKGELVEDRIDTTDTPSGFQGMRRIKVKNPGPLNQLFNDSNYVQLEAAMRMGIDPISGLSNSYYMKRPIVKMESNQYFHIDKLTHSIPYLVPEAAALLVDIGKNFIDSLHNRGAGGYQIRVTSLLRTPESVESLRKININATDSSTHQYATTFDISYSKFHQLDPNKEIDQGDLKNLLAEVLLDLRKQGRCFVKYENQTSCFHVTVNK